MANKLLTRRNFVNTILRNLMLAVLAVITGVLLFRKRDPRSSEKDCLNGGLCSSCAISKDCPLTRTINRQ